MTESARTQLFQRFCFVRGAVLSDLSGSLDRACIRLQAAQLRRPSFRPIFHTFTQARRQTQDVYSRSQEVGTMPSNTPQRRANKNQHKALNFHVPAFWLNLYHHEPSRFTLGWWFDAQHAVFHRSCTRILCPNFGLVQDKRALDRIFGDSNTCPRIFL